MAHKPTANGEDSGTSALPSTRTDAGFSADDWVNRVEFPSDTSVRKWDTIADASGLEGASSPEATPQHGSRSVGALYRYLPVPLGISGGLLGLLLVRVLDSSDQASSSTLAPSIGLVAAAIAVSIAPLLSRAAETFRVRRVEESEGDFLEVWQEFEHSLRSLGVTRLGLSYEDASRYPIGELLRSFVRDGVLDDSQYEKARYLASTRNNFVNGGRVLSHVAGAALVDISELRIAIEHLDRHGESSITDGPS